MKRILAICILFSAILSLFTACKSDPDNGSVTSSTVSGDTPSDIISWVNYSFEKVISNEKIPGENKRSNEISISMCKGESEGCTVSLSSTSMNERMTLSVTEAPDDITVELFKENTVIIAGDKYPDALSPLGDSILVKPGPIQSYFVKVTTTAETEAGDKKVVVVLKDYDGNVQAEYTINVKVWNITFSETRTYQTLTDIEEDQLIRFYKIPEGEEGEQILEELYVQYYEYLLDFRMCAYDLPYDILDDRADKYMSDPRVTAFIVPTDPEKVDNETLKAYYRKLSSNPVWLEKAVAYAVDEAVSPEMYDKMISETERIKTLCPNLKCVSPFFTNFYCDDGLDAVDIQIKYNDILCAKTKMWNEASFASRMAAAKESGKTVWAYICWEPGYPFTNLYVNEKGLSHRIQFWQQYSFDSEGFLYWSANFWGGVDNPWTDAATVKFLSKEVFGDGLLLYNGNFANVDGPCASLRLEIVRDGLEDIELLKMAENVLGREWVMSKVKSVSRSVTSYTMSPLTFNTVRDEIADALEEELNK